MIDYIKKKNVGTYLTLATYNRKSRNFNQRGGQPF